MKKDGGRYGFRGFALTEVLVGGAVFLLLSLGAAKVYQMSLRIWHEGTVQVALQRKLAKAMKQMVNGGQGYGESRQHGLREAREFNVIGPHAIEFTSAVDGQKREFYLNGNELVYKPSVGCVESIYDPSRTGMSWVESNSRTDVQFRELSDGSIEVRLMGEERVRDRWISVCLATRVVGRN